MEQTYILTFVSNDRPGLVEELSEVVEKNGGNWLESRLSQLAGKFAGLVIFSVPGDQAGQLQNDLARLDARGIDITLTLATGENASADKAAARSIRLTVMGPDRPGIVREVARALADRRINVVDMDSHVSSAPMSGESLFNAHMQAHTPASTDMVSLSEALDEIAEQMTLEIDLDQEH